MGFGWCERCALLRSGYLIWCMGGYMNRHARWALLLVAFRQRLFLEGARSNNFSPHSSQSPLDSHMRLTTKNYVLANTPNKTTLALPTQRRKQNINRAKPESNIIGSTDCFMLQMI